MSQQYDSVTLSHAQLTALIALLDRLNLDKFEVRKGPMRMSTRHRELLKGASSAFAASLDDMAVLKGKQIRTANVMEQMLEAGRVPGTTEEPQQEKKTCQKKSNASRSKRSRKGGR